MKKRERNTLVREISIMLSDGVKCKLRAFCPLNSLPKLFFVQIVILLVIMFIFIRMLM